MSAWEAEAPPELGAWSGRIEFTGADPHRFVREKIAELRATARLHFLEARSDLEQTLLEIAAAMEQQADGIAQNEEY